MTGPLHTLAALEAAAAEGLEPNLSRFLAFLGWEPGEVLELQALEVPRARNPWRDGGSYVAHAADLPELVTLVDEVSAWGGPGVYTIFNRVTPGVADRYTPSGAWHRMADRQGTSDGEILARRAVYIDLDADRPKGLSALGEHVVRTFDRAELLAATLARHVPPAALGRGHSGNGAALFVALDDLPCSEDLDRLVRAVLTACKHLAADPETFDPTRTRDEARRFVALDVSVSDRKRLCPAFGSVKAKGGPGLAHRPHRRTAFLASPQPLRLSLEQLRGLLDGLRGELDDDTARAEVDKAAADPRAKTAPRASTGGAGPAARVAARPAAGGAGDDPFRIANYDIDIRDVLARLGLMEGDRPICPGCRRSSKPGGTIEIRGNGLKCSSGTCAGRGHPSRPGFRSVVDLVVEVQGVDPVGALAWLREEFPGAQIPLPRAPSSGPVPPPPPSTPPPSAPPPSPPPPPSSGPPSGGEGGFPRPLPKRSKAQRLVELLQPLQYFRSPTGRLFLEHQGEALATDGERYVELVAALFWEKVKDVAGSSTIEDATRVVAAAARQNVPTPIRLTGDVQRLVLDLGAGAPWVVTPETIDVLDEAPPAFHRPDGSAPLPRPEVALSDEESTEAFADLRRVLGVADDVAWACCLAWLVATLRPIGPYPILVVRGEKGSGKTTLSKALRRIVDPRQPELKTLPKGQDAVRTLAISAEHAHIVGFDNLSHLDAELSDALCRLSTGDGFEARKLWRGRALDVFVACKPILLNGISDAASRADLLDRSLLPPRLPARQEREDDDRIAAQLEALTPRVLGALLWAVHRAMARINEVAVPGTIRMRSAARWAEAAASALGLPPGAVVKAYQASHTEATGIDAEDPVATALIEWMESTSGPAGGSWSGPAGKLLEVLTAATFPSNGRRPPASWPESGRGMGAKLDRIESTLRAAGIDVTKGTERAHGGARLVKLTYTPPTEETGPEG